MAGHAPDRTEARLGPIGGVGLERPRICEVGAESTGWAGPVGRRQQRLILALLPESVGSSSGEHVERREGQGGPVELGLPEDVATKLRG